MSRHFNKDFIMVLLNAIKVVLAPLLALMIAGAVLFPVMAVGNEIVYVLKLWVST